MKKISKNRIDLHNLPFDLMTYGMSIIGNLKEFNDVDNINYITISLGYYYAMVHKQLSFIDLKKADIERIIKDSISKLINIVSKKEGFDNFEYKILKSYTNCYECLKRKKIKKNQIKELSKIYLNDLYGNVINEKNVEKRVNSNLLTLYNSTNNFIGNNVRNQKNFNDKLLKSAIWIGFIQVLIYLFCLITNNFYFDFSSGLGILKLLGINLPLIIVVIFLIIRRKNLRYIFNIKTSKIGMVLIVIFIIITLIIGVFNISIDKVDMNKIDEMIFGPRCETGFDYINNKCVKDIIVNSNIVYKCMLLNYQLEGNQCVQYYNASYFDECPIGYLSWLGYCKKIGATTNYSKCGSGSSYYYFDNMCYPNLPITRKYYCSGGMLLGDKCRQTTSALMNYECPQGYALNITDKTCIKTISKVPLR